MINTHDILETINMIQDENLDIRTITMGISLLDCCTGDAKSTCDKIYEKMTRKAEHLVKTGEDIEKQYHMEGEKNPENKVIVTDNFGITTTKSITINFLSYSLPTITTNTFRCNSGGTATDTGSYVSATANFTVANVGSNAGTCTVTVNGHTATLTSGTPTIINAGLLDSHTYNADYTVTDSFGSTATKTDILLTAFVDFSLHPNGGVAFGGVAEQGKFKTAYPITIGSTQLTEAQLQALLALI